MKITEGRFAPRGMTKGLRWNPAPRERGGG